MKLRYDDDQQSISIINDDEERHAIVLGYGTLVPLLSKLYAEDFPWFDNHGRCKECTKLEEYADARCEDCDKISPEYFYEEAEARGYGLCDGCDYGDCSSCDRIDPDNPPDGYIVTRVEPESVIPDTQPDDGIDHVAIGRLMTEVEAMEQEQQGTSLKRLVEVLKCETSQSD